MTTVGRVQGKIAFVTGAAKGQGRAVAARLADEGADVIVMDICGPIASSVGAPATPEELEETVRLVEKAGQQAHSYIADVRDYDALKAGLDEGVKELGGLDIVLANAGMWNYGLIEEWDPTMFKEVVDICLIGVWHTLRAAVPILKEQGRGGSIILTSSVAGMKAYPNTAPYTAAKHGVMGLMKSAAVELGTASIRVNTVNPTGVLTDLIQNQPTYELFAPDLENPTWEQIVPRLGLGHLLPIPYVLPEDIANAVLFLGSDEARYITGTSIVVDAGNMLK